MKTQAGIVGYVLLVAAITGIVIGVYFWGKPILEKSQAKDYTATLENTFIKMANLISDAAEKRITESYPISISNVKITLSNDLITGTTTIPVAVYATNIPEVPINTEYLFVCDENVVNVPSANTPICKDQTLLVTVNTTSIVLNDTFDKKVIILTRGDHQNVIFGKYVFDIKDYGNKIYFIPKEVVGIKGMDPDCVVTANARTSGNTQIVMYKIKCRTMYDYTTGNCYKIEVISYGSVQYNGEGSVTFTVSYDSLEYKNVSKISTLCKNLEIRKVKVTFT